MGVRTVACILAVGGVLLLASSGSANETTTVRVSVDSAGNPANGTSGLAAISADGRYVAFVSDASNLVLNDNNSSPDAFVHDTRNGATERVSIASDGTEANHNVWGTAWRPVAISDDGRFVAFNSSATNLEQDEDEGMLDVFVHDREARRTILISKDQDGGELRGHSELSDISSDGRFVVFIYFPFNGPAGTSLLWDSATGKTEKVGPPGFGAISADGRYFAYIDGTGVFLRDRSTGSTKTVQPGMTGWPSISSDGRYIAFEWRFDLSTQEGTGIFVYDRETESVNQVASGWMPQISPFGAHVVYIEYHVNYQPVTPRVVDLRTGADEVLLRPPAIYTGYAPQSISGDGRFVVFSACIPDANVSLESCGSERLNVTRSDIYVYDRGAQPDAPTAPPIIDSPLPVLPSEIPTATPCETPAETASPDAPTNETPSPDALPVESSSPDPSADASQSTSATPSEPKEATQSPTPTYFPETSASSSPCSSQPLSADDTAETETSINTPRVAGVAAGAALLVGAASLGYLRLRRRR